MEIEEAKKIIIKATKKKIKEINKMEYGVAAYYYREKIKLEELIEILEFCGLN